MDHNLLEADMDWPMNLIHSYSNTETESIDIMEEMNRIDFGVGETIQASSQVFEDLTFPAISLVPNSAAAAATLADDDGAWWTAPDIVQVEMDREQQDFGPGTVVIEQELIPITMEVEVEASTGTGAEDNLEPISTTHHEQIQPTTSSLAPEPTTATQERGLNPALFRVVIENKDVLMASAMAAGINPAEIQVDEKRFAKPRKKRNPRKPIPEAQRTAEYWAMRAKNTEAARRSRDARRVKENELFLQIAYLEDRYERLQKEYAVMLKAKEQRLRLQVQIDNININ